MDAQFETLESRQHLSAGDLDPTFGTNGVKTYSPPPAAIPIQQVDGKALLVGGAIVRLSADLSLDTTYGVGGTATFPGPALTPDTALLLSDGRLLVAQHDAESLPGPVIDRHPTLFVFDEDGDLDPTFAGDGVLELDDLFPDSDPDDTFDLSIVQLAEQSDGKLVLLGDGGEVVRLTASGVADTSFSGNGLREQVIPAPSSDDVLFEAKTVAVDANDQIILGGRWSRESVGGRFAVARLLDDGSLDTTFSGDGYGMLTTDGVPYQLAVLSSGDILAGGDTTDLVTSGLARFNSDGTLDAGFGDNGVTEIESGFGEFGSLAVRREFMRMVLDPAGRIYVSVRNARELPQLQRFSADGDFDTSFGRVNTLGAVGALDATRVFAFGTNDIRAHLTGNTAGVGPVFAPDGTGRVEAQGTDGNDRFVFIQKPGFITVIRTDGGRTFARSEITRLSLDLGAGDDTLDTISSSLLPVSVSGGPGRDAILTAGGNDDIDGGDGSDSIYAAGGNDVIHGGGGSDRIGVILPRVTGLKQVVSSDGNDTIDGGGGNDLILGHNGNDSLAGGTGNDIIRDSGGDDTLRGDADTDRLEAGDGNNVIFGGDGDDYLRSGIGIDSLWGEAGNDELRAGDGNDFLHGGAGKDRLFGQQGNDRVFGHKGPDAMDGGPGADSLVGSIGDDKFFDQDGAADTLDGGDGDDLGRVDDGIDLVTSIEQLL